MKIYLSSHEYLLEDGIAIYKNYQRLALKYNFELLEMPLELFNPKSNFDEGYKLAKKRLALIKECDILIANTNDFRSYVEPYGETAFELGIGFAYKKKMYAYMDDINNCAIRYKGLKKENDKSILVDENGISFEPGPLNLMLEYSCQIVQGTFIDAIKKAYFDLKES